MLDSSIKIVAVIGPTASGKTALALELARRFNGEIICADSRTVYRGMDIGTAKPSAEEQAMVPHHLLDVVDPGQSLSAGEFKRLAEVKIGEIVARGGTPFLVGGSGLYVDSVLFDYQFPPAMEPDRRVMLEAMSDEELRNELTKTSPEAVQHVDISNRRRVMRALETVGQTRTRRTDQLPNILSLGLAMNKEVAQQRIVKRIEIMLEQGFLDEVRRIGETYGWESEAMTGIGYRAFRDVILGNKPVAEGAAEFAHGDMMLVKKQLTWFRRNKAIHWLADSSDAEPLVETFLAAR